MPVRDAIGPRPSSIPAITFAGGLLGGPAVLEEPGLGEDTADADRLVVRGRHRVAARLDGGQVAVGHTTPPINAGDQVTERGDHCGGDTGDADHHQGGFNTRHRDPRVFTLPAFHTRRAGLGVSQRVAGEDRVHIHHIAAGPQLTRRQVKPPLLRGHSDTPHSAPSKSAARDSKSRRCASS